MMTWIQGNPVRHSWHQFSRASQEGSLKLGLAANTNIDTNINSNTIKCHLAKPEYHMHFYIVIALMATCANQPMSNMRASSEA